MTMMLWDIAEAIVCIVPNHNFMLLLYIVIYLRYLWLLHTYVTCPLLIFEWELCYTFSIPFSYIVFGGGEMSNLFS